jgi:hypothetical protein
MTEISCTYGDNRDEALVAFLYDDADGNPAERDRFAAHLAACARCREDVAALSDVRDQLAHWSPPEPFNLPMSNQHSAISNQSWWRQIPVWAQVAAALLFLGVSAGIANLDVRYDQNGLSVRTGWSDRSGGSGKAGGSGSSGASGSERNVAQGFSPANSDAPWKADIAALESQLKREIHTAQASAPVAAPPVRAVAATDVTQVRTLLAESEKRQQRELALRLAELLRDVNAQRQADLVKIDRTLGVVQNNVGIEVMKNRQQMNQMDLIYRASQRQ